MDGGYTAYDQMQWQREGAMSGEIAYLAEKSAALEKQSKFLHQLCAIATEEQIKFAEGLAEFLLQEKESAEREARTEKFLAEEMDQFLAEEFNRLRAQNP